MCFLAFFFFVNLNHAQFGLGLNRVPSKSESSLSSLVMILCLRMKSIINRIIFLLHLRGYTCDDLFYLSCLFAFLAQQIFFLQRVLCLPVFVLVILKNWCLQVPADFLGLSLAVGHGHTVSHRPLVCSVLGNSMLLRVLPALYEKQPQPITPHLRELVALMAQLDQAEQHHLLRLFQIVARKKELGVKPSLEDLTA